MRQQSIGVVAGAYQQLVNGVSCTRTQQAHGQRRTVCLAGYLPHRMEIVFSYLEVGLVLVGHRVGTGQVNSILKPIVPAISTSHLITMVYPTGIEIKVIMFVQCVPHARNNLYRFAGLVCRDEPWRVSTKST